MKKQENSFSVETADAAASEKKRSGKKTSKIITALLIILFILVVCFFAVFQHFYGKMNFAGRNGIAGLSGNDEGNTTGINDGTLGSLRDRIASELAELDLPNNKDVYNLLLIGVDRRDKSWYGNSDSMILFSVNKKNKEIHMISFMRDLYADIPGVGVRKLNAACAIGGPDLLIETIESNYKVGIDNYAYVDFDGMIALVDAVGGITIDISEAELDAVNGMIRYHCELMNEDPEAHLIPAAGSVDCDGIRAIAYARIRSVGNADYERTERQRIVMTKLVEKIRAMSVPELTSFSDTALPLITHDISQGTVLSLLTQAPAASKYEIVQGRIPYDGLFSVQGELLVPEMTETITRLQEEVYGNS